MKLLGTAAISQFGDRHRRDSCTIERMDLSTYEVHADGIEAIYFETSTPGRIFTVTAGGDDYDGGLRVHVFNADSARWPGAELRVWAYGGSGDDAVVIRGSGTAGVVPPEHTLFQVQPHSSHHRYVRFLDEAKRSFDILLTRDPPTPIVTLFSIVVPKTKPLVLPAVTYMPY